MRDTHKIPGHAAIAASVLCATIAGMPATAALAGATKPAVFPTVLGAEAGSKELCERDPSRIHIATRWGTECIAYFVTVGHESARRAVVFLDGDMSPERISDQAGSKKNLAGAHALLQRWADTLTIRYVYLSRAGLNGSSGNHGQRRQPKETMIMDEALNALKRRLGLDTLALAGQSGGSTIAASLLSLGRRDVACAVLGSGAFELVDLRAKDLGAAKQPVSKAALHNTTLDPSELVDAVPSDKGRRIFVLGDEADVRTPFAQQKRYAERLVGFGHHAKAIAVDAQGELDHGATVYTIPTAGGCLKGLSDDRLATAIGNLGRKIAANAASKAGTKGSLALLNVAIRSADTDAAFAK